MDIVIAALALLLMLPVILVIALLVLHKIGAPVLYLQMRPGKNGKPFQMVKFRTMRDAFGTDGTPLPDSERISAFGRKLRATSLDELPELWNVLKGEMSLVGPRPLLMDYLPLYTHEQAQRHKIRPGITGWAQVNGRNAISWNEKFSFDVWYVENNTIWLDLKIIWITVRKVLIREGISAQAEATMPKFTGKN